MWQNRETGVDQPFNQLVYFLKHRDEEVVQERTAGGKVVYEDLIENIWLAVGTAQDSVLEFVMYRDLLAIGHFQLALQIIGKYHLCAQLVEEIDLALFSCDLIEFGLGASVRQKVMQKGDGIREHVIQKVAAFFLLFFQFLHFFLMFFRRKDEFDIHVRSDVSFQLEEFILESFEIISGSGDLQELDLGVHSVRLLLGSLLLTTTAVGGGGGKTAVKKIEETRHLLLFLLLFLLVWFLCWIDHFDGLVRR